MTGVVDGRRSKVRMPGPAAGLGILRGRLGLLWCAARGHRRAVAAAAGSGAGR